MKRWEWRADWMTESSDGDYVLHEEVEAEIAAIRTKVADLEAENFLLSVGACLNPVAAQDWMSPNSISGAAEIKILLYDGSVLHGAIPLADGDHFWWSGCGSGEKFIDSSSVIGWMPMPKKPEESKD